MPDDSEDLSFVSHDALIEELAKRCEHLVVLSILKADVTDDGEAMAVRYYGGLFAALGLLTHASQSLLDDLRSTDAD